MIGALPPFFPGWKTLPMVWFMPIRFSDAAGNKDVLSFDYETTERKTVDWMTGPSSTGRITGMSTPYGSDWISKYFTQSEEKKMLKESSFELPFKGTANSWWSKDGRVTRVSDLATPHIVNIFAFLHGIADRELKKENPYRLNFSQMIKDNSGFYHNSHQRRVWLLENCITYLALAKEAIRRSIWNYNENTAKLPKNQQAVQGQGSLAERMKSASKLAAGWNQAPVDDKQAFLLVREQNAQLQVDIKHYKQRNFELNLENNKLRDTLQNLSDTLRKANHAQY